MTAVNGERTQVDLARSPLAERYEVDGRVVCDSSAAAALFLDRGLLQVAARYLDCIPIIDIATAWYSFPSTSASREAAQLFHFDLDRVRWLKMFIYLTDVGPLNGPHTLIPGTHRDGAIPKEVLRYGYTRLDDDTVARHFPRESWYEAVGPKGFVLLEDTRGLHKGAHLLKGHRLVAQVQYSASLFGEPSTLTRRRWEGSRLEAHIPVPLRAAMLPQDSET
jgi:hypothetical protein